MTREEFFTALLNYGLGISPSTWAVVKLVGWSVAESGTLPLTGVPGEGARYNPLNTTYPMAGSTDYRATPTVQSYASVEDGILATARTLKLATVGAGPSGYDAIRQALKHRLRNFPKAVGNSQWGTSGPMVRACISRVRGDSSILRLKVGEQ